jgi:transposase
MSKAMSSDPTAPPVHGEILTGVQRRRRWSTTEKIRLVEESQQPGSPVSFVARRYGLSPSLLFSWQRRMLEGGHQAVHADEAVVGTSRVRALERRVRDLERLLGRKTMEVEFLKEALDLARTKDRSRRSAPGAVRRAVRGEGGRRHARRGPLPPGRAPESTRSAARPVP